MSINFPTLQDYFYHLLKYKEKIGGGVLVRYTQDCLVIFWRIEVVMTWEASEVYRHIIRPCKEYKIERELKNAAQ